MKKIKYRGTLTQPDICKAIMAECEVEVEEGLHEMEIRLIVAHKLKESFVIEVDEVEK